MALTTAEIAECTGGRLIGPGDLTVSAFEAMDQAQPGQITFITDAKRARLWDDCQATAALIAKDLDLEPGEGRALIEVNSIEVAQAHVLDAFAPPQTTPPQGVHPTAIIDESAQLADDVCIGPGCVVGARVKLEPGVVLHANVTLFDDVVIGAGSVLWSGAVVRERCEIGSGCTLHCNAVIGADGFSFVPAPDGKGILRIPQIGTVKIGHQVEIGANSCVDRAKFSATTIGDGTKIDNLVQIGHNCRIGRCVIIAGCCAVGGSTTIGDGTVIGGGCRIRDNALIGTGVTLAGGSGMIDTHVPDGETWAGVPAFEGRVAVRQHFALQKLPGVLKQLKKKGVID